MIVRNYEKQKEIEKLFSDNGFSDNEFVVGTGETFSTKGKNTKRFEFNAREREEIINCTALYAVKYFSKQDFYIVWKIRCKTTNDQYSRRTILSIDYETAIEAYKTNQKASKGVNFKWRLQENVMVINFEGLKSVIKSLREELTK